MKLVIAISALIILLIIVIYNLKKADLNPRNLNLVGLFAALTAIGAWIKIPIPYVPFTLQLFFCIMSGLLLGARLGLVSQLVYVFIGLVGVPVFTNGGGLYYIFQPTFGYLIGFIVGAYVAGLIVEKVNNKSFKVCLIASLVSMMVVYLFGVPYLFIIKNYVLASDSSFSLWNALYYGFLISVLGDIVCCVGIAYTTIYVDKGLNVKPYKTM